MPIQPDTYYDNSRATIEIIEQLETDALDILTKEMSIQSHIDDPDSWRSVKLQNLNRTTDKFRRVVEAADTDAAVADAMIKNITLGIEETDQDMIEVSNESDTLAKRIDLAGVPSKKDFLADQPLRIQQAITNAQGNIDRVRLNMLSGFDNVYLDIVNRSSLLQQTGVLTMDQAIQRTLDEWANAGIPALIDRAGKRWSARAYAENIMRSESLIAYRVAQEERQKSYGFYLIQISTHSDCSPLCRPWQGRVYNLDDSPDPNGNYPDLKTAVDGGLYHKNCKHYQSPYFPNISRVQKAEDNKTIDKKWKQNERQRQIERNIRTWKNRKVVAMTPEAEEKANTKIRQWQGEMRTFINETGRTRQRSREQI